MAAFYNGQTIYFIDYNHTPPVMTGIIDSDADSGIVRVKTGANDFRYINRGELYASESEADADVGR